MSKEYYEFLEKKKHSIGNFGFKANYIPDIAFDFQEFIINKSIEKGRSRKKQCEVYLKKMIADYKRKRSD